jgi:hypothetical protein
MNPAIAHLGLPAEGRALVVHADDVSLCQASLASYRELREIGLVTSGSLMVPAPWFRAAAAYARSHPEADLGLHTTLTCEWEGYRWAPLTTRDPATGLLDEEGGMPRSQVPLWKNAQVGAALLEIEAQLRTAREAGVQVTHVDDHMGVWGHPRFAPHYARFCVRHRLPARYAHPSGKLTGDEREKAEHAAAELYAQSGLPLFDRIGGLPLDDADPHEERILAFAAEIPPGGLGLLIAHPALETPELCEIAPDWRGRVANHRALASCRVKLGVEALGVRLVGYGQINRMINPE